MGVIPTAEILRIADLLYTAAAEDDAGGAAHLAWNTALDLLGDTCCAGGTAILAINQGLFCVPRTSQVGVPLTESAKHMSDHVQPDPVLEQALARSACGTLLLSEELRAGAAPRRSGFCAALMPHRGECVAAAAKLVDDSTSRAVLYLARDRRAGSFSTDEVNAITQLLPHVRRATALAIRLRDRDAVSVAAGSMTSKDAPLMIVDRNAVPCYVNATGGQLLKAGDRISVAPTRGAAASGLTLPSASDTRRLRSLIAASCGMDNAATSSMGAIATMVGTVSCLADRGRSAAATLLIRISPLPITVQPDRSILQQMLPNAMNTRSIVTCVDLLGSAGRARPDGQVTMTLCQAFGLTVAEAEVAIAIAEGNGLTAVAAQRQVSLATVRTQAAQAYQKAGVRGQVELATLVARLSQLL